MSEIYKMLKELANIEEKLYILDFVCRNKDNLISAIEKEATMPKMPDKPPAPRKRIYPEYNEEIYLRKAKEQEKGKFQSIRDNGFVLAMSLIPTIIGIIPAIVILWGLLLTFPFAIADRRKNAHKIYIDECEKLKKEYAAEEFRTEQYNKELEKYKQEIEAYKSKISDLPAKKTRIEQLTQLAINEIEFLRKKRQSLIESNDTKQRNWCFSTNSSNHSILPHILCYYFQQFNLTYLDEAFTIYEQEQKRHKNFPCSIEDTWIWMEHGINLYPSIISDLEKTEEIKKSIYDDIIKKYNLNSGDYEKTILEEYIANNH